MAAPFRQMQAVIVKGASLLRPTLGLFAIDTFANLIDYLFHVYLGRSLAPGDFAAFQAVNAALLIAISAFGVLQPVLARFVAEAEIESKAPPTLTTRSRLLFRTYLGWSGLAGALIAAALFTAAEALGGLLHVPGYSLRLAAFAVFLILLRPVVAGTLQGAQRFAAFGTTRVAHSLGRFGFAAAALAAGSGLPGVFASLPVGQGMAVAAGLIFLGTAVWKPGRSLPAPVDVGAGLRLAGWAFLAYAAFTSMQNVDLLWVNRFFDSAQAGGYAAAVLLRRILILFPAAAAVVLFPRTAARYRARRPLDRQLGLAILFVAAAIGLLALLYAAAGPAVVLLVFGPSYTAAGPLLGLMGAAMLGYGITSIWLSIFLATRPAAFVLSLTAAAGLQVAGLALFGGSPWQVATVFAVTGWLPVLAGAWIYFGRLRPGLKVGADA